MKHYLVTALAAAILCSCGHTAETEVPQETENPHLLSSSPNDGQTGVSRRNAEVLLTFDQSVFCPMGERSRISISPKTERLDITQAGKDIKISLGRLEYSTCYILTIPKGCISGYKDNVADGVTLSFTTEDKVEPGKDIAKIPCNPNASANTMALYSRLLDIYGQQSLSGAMGGTAWETSYTDYIGKQTGKYPAIVGFDYLFNNWPAKAWDTCPDYNDISVIRKAWQAGNIIQIGWHWNMPRREGETDPNNYSFYNNPVQAERVATEGTWENAEMKRQIAQIAGFLQRLQKEDIPVLWRPLHEAAGDYRWGAWFWWGNGGSEPCKAIWHYMYDTFTNEYGLNNLLWVWTAQTSDGGTLSDVDNLIEWYPGDDCVDIVGADLYLAKGVKSSPHYKLVNESVNGKKMVALSEFGNLPDLDECAENEALWLYFMNWCNFADGNPVLYCRNEDGTYSWNNTVEEWKAIQNSNLTINR